VAAEEVARVDPREKRFSDAPVPSGEGRFLVVRRQSDEPRGQNAFVTDDGWEMVANHQLDDARADHTIRETLDTAGLDWIGSCGHGIQGTYVAHEQAERARRLLERRRGAQIWVRTPDGAMSIAHEEPAPSADSDDELVAGLLSPREGDRERIAELLRIAGIPERVMPRHGTLSFYAPPGRAADARWLIGRLPGAVRIERDGELPDANLVVFPPEKFPRHDPDSGAYVNIAHFRDLDETCHAKVFGALDRAGIAAMGVGNAGGASVSVQERDADRARRLLWTVPGAQRPWREGDAGPTEHPFGRFHVDGVDDFPPRITEAVFPQVQVAERAFLDSRDRAAVGYSLYAAGFNTSGSAEWEDDRLLIRFTVPEAEAPAAQRLLELLDL
jgi:hypothetical protein